MLVMLESDENLVGSESNIITNKMIVGINQEY